MFEAGYELRQVSAIVGWSASQEVRMAPSTRQTTTAVE